MASNKNKKSFFYTFVQYFVILFLCFLLIDYFFFRITAYIENFSPSIPNNSRVIINQMTYKETSVQRWDLVYMENPNNSNEYMIRRVLALPGEKILLQKGEVFINDLLVQKPLDLQKGLWVKTFDLTKSLQSGVAVPEIFDYIDNQNWQINPDGSLISKLSAEKALISFNSEMYQKKGSDHNTIDLSIEFELTFKKDSGRLVLMADYYSKKILVNFPSAIIQKTPHIQEEKKILKTFQNFTIKPGVKYKIALWVFDHKIGLLINNKLYFNKKWGVDITPDALKQTKFVIGSFGAAVKLENIKIDRDISFESNGRFGCIKDTPFQSKEGEVFVSTDNSGSAQTDSRTLGGIKIDKFIRGKAVMTFYPDPFEWLY